MKLFIGKDYDGMSVQAAAAMLEILQEKEQPLVCMPSGSSPVGLCKEIRNHYKATNSKPDWYFVGLDEWVGMNGADPGGCRYFFDEHLFKPLAIEENRISFFDGKASDLSKECDKAENFIKEHGGMQIAVLGIGMNGHLGFNEPGTEPSTRAHVIDLHDVTVSVGQKYFAEKKHLDHGITLGLATLFEAKTVFLLVNGKHKAGILKQTLEGKISTDVPASLLRNHPDFVVYADADAASELS